MRLNSAAKLFAAYAVLVIYLCLFPWTPKPGAPGPWLSWDWAGGRSGLADFLLNIALFVPLGVSGRLAFRGGGRAVPVVLLCAALSFLIELLQGWLPGRVSSMSDLLGNTTGAALGCVAAPWLASLARHEVSSLKAARVYAPAAALAIAFFAGQTFPFIPRYRLPHLRNALGPVVQLGDGMQAFTVLLVLAAAAYFVRLAIKPPLREGWRLLVMVAFLFLRPLFGNIPFTGGEWVAAFLGSAAGVFLRPGTLERALSILLPLAVLIEEFRPFAFAAQPQAFGWIPFTAVFEISPITAIHHFAGKFFLYGATIFILARRGIPPRVGTPALLVLLAAGEAAQRCLPGRTPESTDLFLALAAWLLLSLLGTESSPGPRRPAG